MQKGGYKYQRAKQQILKLAREVPENTPLPNRNELSKLCSVSRVTLERAISELIGEGVLKSLDGRGTYLVKETDGYHTSTAVWALLVYSVTKGTAPTIVRGVEDFANDHGVSLVVCNTDNDPKKENDYLKRVCQQDIGGIILIPSTHSVPETVVFDSLEKKGVPVVACSRQVPGYDFPGTFQNFFQAGLMATQHLLQSGCRHIAYLATSRYSTIEDRLQGYLAALSQHNSENPDDPVSEAFGLSSVTGDFEEHVLDFLSKHPDTDGIYVFIDHLVVTLYTVMERLGLRPGVDIRVIASDDSGFSGAFRTPLSTVDFPTYHMGRLAAQQLHSLITGMEFEEQPRHMVLSCEVHARQSTLM